MDNMIYNILNNYFNALTNTGYKSYNSVEKILALICIQEFLDEFKCYISDEDYSRINKALTCLYGSDCLIPYPDYYNNSTMSTGSPFTLNFACTSCPTEDIDNEDLWWKPWVE